MYHKQSINMDNQQINILAYNHVSIDCVVVGFDGEKLKVLLIKRIVDDFNGANERKLPGSLIYMDEDLDAAASRVLFELTGINNVNLAQFKAFGSKDRTKNPKDILWLERAVKSKIERIITIGYIATVNIDTEFNTQLDKYQASWVAVDEIEELAFDHNIIINEALLYINYLTELNLAYLFELLPPKFTIAQFRNLLGLVKGKTYDVKNFHKKLPQMPYLVQLEEKELGVAHRAAKYYKFDRKIYNKLRK